MPRFLETQEIQLFSLERLVPEAVISSPVLLDYAREKIKGLENPVIEFKGSTIDVSGVFRRIPFRAQLDVLIRNNRLMTHLLDIRLLGIPLPKIVFRAVTDQDIPLTPYSDTPFYLDIKNIHGTGDQLQLEGAVHAS